MPCKVFAHEGLKVFCAPLRARSRSHECDHPLSPLLVGYAHHRDVAHAGVSEENLFDFPGIDILSTPNDHVLDAANNLDVAPRIHRSEVARMQPARFIDGRFGRFGVVVIAVHHPVSPGADLALDLRIHHLPACGIDDLYRSLGKRAPDGLGLVLG